MKPDAQTVQKEALEKANDLIDRFSNEGAGAQLFTTEFKDRFIDEIRAYELFMRSQTSQEANEAIITVFERTMTQMNIDDRIKAPLRSAFALQLIGTS